MRQLRTRLALSTFLTLAVLFAAIAYAADPGPTLIDSGGVGSYSSLVVVNGNPAISYYNLSEDTLRYVRATDAKGSAWGAPITVDPGGAGAYTSMVVANGHPAISYYATGGGLRYVRANDPSGTAWGNPITLNDVGNVGQFTSMTLVGGHPAIAYYDVTNADVKYIRANDPSGTAWSDPITLDDAGNVGQYASLAVINGNPAVSYYDATNQDLKFVRATDTNGSTWGAPIIVLGSDAAVGEHSSLAEVNGNPAISYYYNFKVHYVRATNTNGSTWGSGILVDLQDANGFYTSLEVINGRPAIAYYNLSSSSLRYARAGDADGATWTHIVTWEAAGVVGLYPSLAMVDGSPAISYHANANALRYQRGSAAAKVTLGATGSARVNGGIDLSWTTTNEPDVQGFQVLRSPTGQLADAVSLGELIPSTGGPGAGSSYSFTDASPIPGAVYWIRSINNDGTSELAGPISEPSAHSVIYLPMLVTTRP